MSIQESGQTDGISTKPQTGCYLNMLYLSNIFYRCHKYANKFTNVLCENSQPDNPGLIPNPG